MSAVHVTPPGARRAASVLVLRDGEDGLEVLMLRRAERAGDQRSGAVVFPGGVLDAGDRAAHRYCTGADDAGLSARLGLDEGALDYAVAGVRECFEEVGLLLADGPFALPELAPWRERLQRGETTLAALCEAAGLSLPVGRLAYYSHWLTPPGMPLRFDTRFFAVLAPPGQQAVADNGEAVELMWLRPAAALEPARGLKLMAVTQRTLADLGRFHRAEDAWAEAGQRRDIRLVMPRRGNHQRGPRVVLPDELPYAEIARLDPEGRGDVSTELLPGVPVRLSANVIRVTAPNPGPMTGPGTNSYLVGAGEGDSGRWTVIDPGPAMQAHVQALLAAAPGRITRILTTHTHRDHSPAAPLLAAATGAPVWGRVAAHPEWQDPTFAPAYQPVHGEVMEAAPGVALRVLHTPGHASNHLCFLLEHERLLFTGDHVMQGSTVVINPPDGDMVAYLASLNELLGEDLQWLAPGHGFLVGEPHAVLRGLIAHRLKREAKVVAALSRQASASLPELLPLVYDDVPAALHPVAARSLLAHLLKLQHDGRASVSGEGAWSGS